MSDDDTDEPDKVGPGKPPKEYRWEKGCRSPNPSGRPPSRKREAMLAPLDKLAEMIDRFMSRQLNGPDSPELRESLIHKIAELALGKRADGDPPVPAAVRLQALLLLRKIDRDASDRLEAEKQKQFLSAMDYKEYWTPRFRDAERLGRRKPDILPHPDDIVLHRDGRVEMVGPILPQEGKIVDDLVAHRCAIEECLPGLAALPDDATALKLLRTFRRQWNQMNKLLPPRLVRPFPETEANRGD